MSQEYQLGHLGLVVKDLQGALEQFKKTGLGTPGEVMPMEQDGELVAKMCMVQVGPLELELFQHVSGNTMISQFIDAHGDGLHHISFVVADLDAEVDRLTGNGLKLLWKKDIENGKLIRKGKIAFLDAEQITGTLIELEQIDQ